MSNGHTNNAMYPSASAIFDMIFAVEPSNDKRLFDTITIFVGKRRIIPYVSTATILIDKHLVD